MNTNRSRHFLAIAAAALCMAAPGVRAATFGELSNGAGNGTMPPPYSAGPYASAPGIGTCPPDCYPAPVSPHGGPEGMPPSSPLAAVPYIPPAAAEPRAFLPLGNYASGPNTQMMLWSFGQINSTTDPYDPWGFSTPYMYVPWSTPLSGWTNAATWNWWRERSGALPRNW